jgi:hypothetical protein
VAVSGRLTSGQRAQLVLHCSDHFVGCCGTCQLDLSLADVFAQLGGNRPHVCPRCGDNVASALAAHISTCQFIDAGLSARLSHTEAPYDPAQAGAETGPVPEYALVRQLFRSRQPTKRFIGWGLSAIAASLAMLVWIAPAGLSRWATEGTPDRQDSEAPATLASIHVPSIVIKPHGHAVPPAPGKPVYSSAETPRPDAIASSIRETASTPRTVVAQVWDRADGPEDARPITRGVGRSPVSTTAARTPQIRPVATVSRTAPRNAPVIMTSTPTSASVTPTACLFTDRLARDLRRACDHLHSVTRAL